MIEVYDLNLKRTAVLQNAFGGEEEEVLNDVPSYSFRIPSGDEKCRYLQKRHFVRANSGAMYRIMELEETNDDAMGVTAVTCEGVLGTLADTLLFGDVTRDNVSTRENLEWALSHRNDWQHGECDFERAVQLRIFQRASAAHRAGDSSAHYPILPFRNGHQPIPVAAEPEKDRSRREARTFG